MPVLSEEFEVVPRLDELGAPRALLLDVVRAAVGARRDATPFHPLNAGGQLAYQHGTAHLRRVFLPIGWEICRRENIESIFNPTTGIKIVYQNADRAGDPLFEPVATSKKGDGAARAVQAGQGEFWPDMRAAEVREINATTWYLFVEAEGGNVRAELSCPASIQQSQFAGFNERIMLVQHGEWDSADPLADDKPPLEFEVPISRKN